MNLAIICRPLSFHGGVETATAGLIAALLRQGHAVDLLSTREQGEVPGATVRRLPVLGQPSLLRLLSFALAARRAVRGRGYDIVQSHERCLFQDIYRAGEGTHRGYLDAMERGRARANPYHAAVSALETRIFGLRTARHIVAISRQGKTEIESRYATPAERVSLIYNGVDLARFHPDHRARFGRATREALGIGAEEWMVLFVGSGFERKGLGPLLEAMAICRERRARLVIAGRGNAAPYRRLAAGLGVQSRLVWTGARADIERLYAAADLVAIPSRYEPFGNAHLEALASGVPVLTTARAGGSEVVTTGRNGWVVPAPEPHAIAAGLAALRDADVPALRQAARESAEPFTHAAQARAFAALYRLLRS
jgi:UDP-glucose:(heptosyl)LPS alpha-1,3-glucosyltransferase